MHSHTHTIFTIAFFLCCLVGAAEDGATYDTHQIDASALVSTWADLDTATLASALAAAHWETIAAIAWPWSWSVEQQADSGRELSDDVPAAAKLALYEDMVGEKAPSATRRFVAGLAFLAIGEGNRARALIQTAPPSAIEDWLDAANAFHDPNQGSAVARFFLADALARTGDLSSARSVLEELIGDPRCPATIAPMVRNALGLVAWMQGDWAAQGHFRDAQAGGFADPWINLGLWNLASNGGENYEETHHCLIQARSLDPDNLNIIVATTLLEMINGSSGDQVASALGVSREKLEHDLGAYSNLGDNFKAYINGNPTGDLGIGFKWDLDWGSVVGQYKDGLPQVGGLSSMLDGTNFQVVKESTIVSFDFDDEDGNQKTGKLPFVLGYPAKE